MQVPSDSGNRDFAASLPGVSIPRIALVCRYATVLIEAIAPDAQGRPLYKGPLALARVCVPGGRELLSFPEGLAADPRVNGIEHREGIEIRDCGHSDGIGEMQHPASSVGKRRPGRQVLSIRVARARARHHGRGLLQSIRVHHAISRRVARSNSSGRGPGWGNQPKLMSSITCARPTHKSSLPRLALKPAPRTMRLALCGCRCPDASRRCGSIASQARYIRTATRHAAVAS